jgi:hypothetical protein
MITLPVTRGAASPAGAEVPAPEAIAVQYRRASGRERALLLEVLLRPVGPLALVVVADGVFRPFFYRLRSRTSPIAGEETLHVSPEDVLRLACYVQQCDPDLLAVAAACGNETVGT